MDFHIEPLDICLPDKAHIVVIRLDHIGDVVLTLPFFRELARALPHASIEVIVTEQAVDLFRHCEFVTQVTPFSPKPVAGSKFLGQLFGAFRLFRDRYSTRQPDLAISPRFGPEVNGASLVALATGAKYRLAYRKKRSLRPLTSAFHNECFTHLLTAQSTDHEMRRNFALLRALGHVEENDAQEFWLSACDRIGADRLLEQIGVSSGTSFCTLAPGTMVPHNAWPSTSFALVAQEVWRHLRIPTVIVGSYLDEASAAKIIEAGPPATYSLCGKTTLLELAAILSRATILIATDSGPGHIAAAVDTPVITVSSFPLHGDDDNANSPKRFRCWGKRHTVVQPHRGRDPCQRACTSPVPHCILQVRPDRVASAALATLNKSSGSSVRSSP